LPNRPRSHHQWIYELTPDGPDATIVTETYDCTRAPEWLRRAVSYRTARQVVLSPWRRLARHMTGRGG